MIVYVTTSIGAVFVLLTLLAMLSDAWRMEIPNYISTALVIFFTIFIASTNVISPTYHLVTAVIVFACATGFFALGWLGGGDVKFLSATALWAGPDLILPTLLLMSVVGVGLSISIAILRTQWAIAPGNSPIGSEARGPRLWAQAGACPYGIAIGIASLTFIAPNIFAV